MIIGKVKRRYKNIQVDNTDGAADSKEQIC